MGKKNRKHRAKQGKGKSFGIEIGSVEPALEQTVSDFLTTFWDEVSRYWNPPVNFDQLTKVLRINAHHESAIFCKTNTVTLGYEPDKNSVISAYDMQSLVFDHTYLGNGYLKAVENRLGDIVRFDHLHAKNTRRGKEPDEFYHVNGMKVERIQGQVIHIKTYAPESSIYGLPEYLGALQSILLNEAGTLFRRKYYVNGAHMGFILTTVGEMDDVAFDTIKEKIKTTKGAGNFQNMFIHMEGEGKVDLLPVGDFAKDDFEKIKNISRNDIISAHRIPPSILAVIVDGKSAPEGDLDKIVNLYSVNTVTPIQKAIERAINPHLPDSRNHIKFNPYQPALESSGRG